MKIRGAFATYLFSVTALLAGAAALTSWSWRESLRDQAVRTDRLAVAHAAQRLTAPLNQARQTLRLLALSPELTREDEPRVRTQLQRWNAQSGVFEAFFLNTLTGAVTPATGPAFDVTDRPYFPALARGEEVVSAPIVSRASQVPIVLLTVPTVDAAGRTSGALAGTLRVSDVLEGLTAERLPSGTTRTVFDAAGRVLDSSAFASLRPLTPQDQAPTALQALWSSVQAARGTGDSQRGEPMTLDPGPASTIAHAAHVPGLDWTVVLVQSEATMLAPASRATALAGLLLAMVLGAGLGGYALLDRRFVRRIQALIDAHEAWKAGRQTLALQDRSDDELSALAEAFNRSAQSVSEAERRFQAIFEAMPQPVVMSRVRDGVAIEVNAAYEQMLGSPRSEIIGRTAAELGADASASAEARNRLLESGRLDAEVIEVPNREGGSRWIQYSTRLAALQGEQVAISAVFDVTALKDAELALRRSQQMLQALVQQAPVPMSYSPLNAAGQIERTYWNQAWYATFGHPPGSKEGMPGASFGFWSDAAERDGYVARIAGGEQIKAMAARVRDAHGHELLCELYGDRIDTGRERFLMSTFIDVTQQRADAQRLKDFQTMVRSADDGMLFIDDGVIIAANPAAQRLFGRDEASIVGQMPAALSPPLQPDGQPSEVAAREHIGRTPDTGSERFLWEHQRGDGSCFSAQVTLSAVDGYPQRLIAVVRDVTQEQAATRALQQSEARFKSIIAVSDTGAWEVNRRNGHWWCSPEWFTMLGRDPAAYTMDGRANVNQVWIDLVHPEDRDRVTQHFSRYLAQGSSGLFESYFRMRHADGSWVWILSRGQTLRHPDGSLSDVTVGLHINVTEQRLAEQRLRDSQALLAATFDLLPEPLALADDEDGRYIDVNRMWVERLGIPREAAIGHTSLELGMWQNAADRTAVRDLLARDGHIEGAPVTFLRADGERIDCEASASRIEVGGRRIGLWLTRDVTERNRVQAAAEMSRIQLMANLDNTPTVAVQWFDRDGRVLYWNPASEALYGIAASEVLGRLPVGTLYRDEAEFQALVDVLREIEGTGQAVGPYELDITRRDGRVVSVLATTFPIPMGDGQTGFVCMDVDITERKRLELELRELAAQLEDRVEKRTAALEARNDELRRTQAELVRSEKLAALGALVAGVAHELNTPIGNATMVASTLAGRQREFEAGMADGLRRSALQGFLQNTREISEVLDRNLHRAAELIASFKQLAVDQTSDQRRRFALHDVVGEVLLALSPTLKRARVEPELAIDPGLTLDSYPGPLGQVLMNLINNALMHGFGPGVPGRLWIQAQPRDGDHVLLALRDDGKGIAPEHLKRIFDPFFTTRLGQGGSGLGLHIVHNLVTGPLGGRIDVASAPGEGTVFEIVLPLSAPVPAGGLAP